MKQSLIGNILALAFILAVGIGGAVYPLIGLAVPLMIVLAFAGALLTKRKWFCSATCPRGRGLFFLKFLSRYKALPTQLANPRVGQSLCAFMMMCSVMQITRLHPSYAGFSYLGGFFWGMCMLTLAASVFLALAYKPRAWCVVCPMGTLQKTVSAKRRRD